MRTVARAHYLKQGDKALNRTKNTSKEFAKYLSFTDREQVVVLIVITGVII